MRKEGRGPTWSQASYRVCVSVGPPTHDAAPKRIGGGPKVFERKLIFNFMLAPGHFRLAPETGDNPRGLPRRRLPAPPLLLRTLDQDPWVLGVLASDNP